MFSVWRMLLGFVIAAVGHGVAIGAGILAAAIVQPSSGGGFEDLAAAVGTFFVIEILLFIALAVATARLLSTRRRDLALGLMLGWLAGWVWIIGSRLVQ